MNRDAPVEPSREELIALIAAQAAEIAALRAHIAELERRLGLNSSNSGKPPSSDGLKKPPRVASLRERSGNKPGGQKGHDGETLRQVAEPDKIIDHYPRACAECGLPLTPAMATGVVCGYPASDGGVVGTPWDKAPAYIVRDNDRAFGSVFRRRIQAMGIRDRPTSFRSPWQNGHVERLIGSIRRECTDHLIVLNEEHLRRILAKFSPYYNGWRPHVSLGKDAPDGRPIERFGDIVAHAILGGLHHRYARI